MPSGIRTRTSGIMVNVNVTPASAPAVYQGPGDIVSGAYAWWGLRAYTLASIGVQNVVTLFFTDSTTITYKAIAGGGLDVAQITTDIGNHGGGSAQIDTLFDQTGNGRDIAHGGRNRPLLSLSGNGLTVPCMGISVASANGLDSASFGTRAQPLTYGAVANHTASASQQNLILNFNGGNAIALGQYRITSNNTVAVGFAGTVAPDIALNDGTWAAIQCTFTNTTNDRQGVNGFQQTGTNLGANTLDITFQLPQASAPFDGFVAEAGVWGIEFTGTQMTNMYQNQKAYYGLP